MTAAAISIEVICLGSREEPWYFCCGDCKKKQPEVSGLLFCRCVTPHLQLQEAMICTFCACKRLIYSLRLSITVQDTSGAERELTVFQVGLWLFC